MSDLPASHTLEPSMAPPSPETIRDIMNFTRTDVLQNLDTANTQNVALVYGASHLTWQVTDNVKLKPDTETIARIDQKLADATPEYRFDFGIALAKDFGDMYGTWGTDETAQQPIPEGHAGYVSPVPENLRQKAVEHLAYGITHVDDAASVAMLGKASLFFSGRVVDPESFFEPADLQRFIEKIAPVIEKAQGNAEAQVFIDKFRNDLVNAQKLKQLESYETVEEKKTGSES